MYAGFVAGAIQREAYLELILLIGFKNTKLQKEKSIMIPEDILRIYLSEEDLVNLRHSGMGTQSITVYAEKPSACRDTGCCN